MIISDNKWYYDINAPGEIRENANATATTTTAAATTTTATTTANNNNVPPAEVFLTIDQSLNLPALPESKSAPGGSFYAKVATDVLPGSQRDFKITLLSFAAIRHQNPPFAAKGDFSWVGSNVVDADVVAPEEVI